MASRLASLMKSPRLGRLVALALAASAPALGDTPAPAPSPSAEAEIPFANHGGIWDWRADGPGAILIKSRSGHYYRATFMAPCIELPFAQRVGFVTDARDVLDRFQSITVGRDRCQFQTFTEIAKPGNW